LAPREGNAFDIVPLWENNGAPICTTDTPQPHSRAVFRTPVALANSALIASILQRGVSGRPIGLQLFVPRLRARAIPARTRSWMILVDGDSKEILGASLLGTGCDEVVHTILDLMYAKAPYTVMQRAMHIHPTVSELLPTILSDLKPVI
jgi:hypothetical protein